MKKRILFRADGNAATGLGHLYRLFALVEVLRHHYNYVYLTKESSTTTVIPPAYDFKIIPGEVEIKDEPKWLSDHFLPSECIVIADGYQFNSAYQEQLKKAGFSLVYIDDLVATHIFADIVINHSPGVTASQYKAEAYTRFALGTPFAILRPAFLEAARQSRSIETIDTAFVCFGGADALDLSYKAVQALDQIPQIRTVHVVLGGAYGNTGITEFIKGKNNIRLHRDLDEQELIALMRTCNLAIAPSSTIVYELCAVKMPILSGYYVDNQKSIYQELALKKAVFKGGDLSGFEAGDFVEHLTAMLENNNIDDYLDNQSALFDGKSGIRLLGLINSLAIGLRKAREDDMLRVFHWSNDPVVRQNSYHTAAISLESHQQWFSAKITNPNTLFLIVEVNGEAAGVVRFEIKGDHAVVGILVSEEFRGQVLASSFLKESAKKYFKVNKQPIFAYIKKQNVASVKTFEKAGYHYLKDKIVEGQDSFVYKMEV